MESELRELALYYLKRIGNTERFEHIEELLVEHTDKQFELYKKYGKELQTRKYTHND